MKGKLNYKHSTYMYMIIFILYIAVNIILVLTVPWFRKNDTQTLIPRIAINESIVLFPMLIFLIIKGENLKKTLRFNKISLKQILLCFVLFLCALFISGFFNNLSIFICRLFGIKYTAQSIPIAKESTGLLLSIIFVGMVPAFCEDMFFRGFMLSGCQKKGFKFGIICTAFCFALMHLNGSIFLSIFSMGIILALAVYYTDSIWAGVFIHFCNNTLSTIMRYALPYLIAYLKAHSKNSNISVDKIANQVNSDPMMDIIKTLAITGLLAVGAIVIAYIVLEKLKEIWIENRGLEKENDIVEEKYPIYRIFNIPVICSVVIFAVYIFLPQIITIMKRII